MSDSDSEKLPPIHPGEILNEEFLLPLGISSHQLAEAVGVEAGSIISIVQGEEAVTAETALLLARYFSTSARFWTGLQSQYELEVAKDRMATKLNAVKRHKWNGAESGVRLPSTNRCWCGCGDEPNPGRSFKSGHDQRALHKVIENEYGSVLEFLRHHDYSFDGEKVN